MQKTSPFHFVVQKISQLSLTHILLVTLPILLSLGLGFLITKGYWQFAIILALLAPLVVLFSAHPFLGVILWLLLMPLSSALPNPDLMYWALHRILIPFTLCIALLPHLLGNTRLPPSRLGMPEFSIALLVVYVSSSILLGSADSRLSLIRFADRMFIPFCMYLIIRLTVLRSREMQHLQWVILFIAASQCVIGFLSIIAPQYLPYAWRPLIRGYAAGTLLNPNVFASVLGFCICFLFQAFMQEKSRTVKFLLIATCGVSVIGIFLSMERAAWLAGILVILGLFVLYPKIMLRTLIISAIFMILVGGVFFSKQIGRVTERLNNQQTVDVRIVVTNAMIHMIQTKPIFGWGYESLNQHIKNYYQPTGMVSSNMAFTTSHNTFLTILTELGLVGFFLYLLPVAWLFTGSLRAWRRPPRMDSRHWLLLATFWLAVLQYIVITNFMDMRFFPIGLTLWWIILGMIANLLNNLSEAQKAHVSNRVTKAWNRDRLFEESFGGPN